ncbi:MAG: ATP-grasp domain-containing protein [Opitutaceae bacterium]
MKLNILISSAGRRGQLIECFREAGRDLGIEVGIFASDVRPELSAACQLADGSFGVPRCDAPDFVPALLAACAERSVRLIVPTIDLELAVLSEQRARFAAAGVEIAVSEPEVIALARDKERTARELAGAGVRTPGTVAGARYLSEPTVLGWPVIVKPRSGSSSVGMVRPQSPEEAAAAIRAMPDAIVQELWAGREYTVNLFFDRSGILRCSIPHLRIETRGGEVSQGRTEDVPVLRAMARDVARALAGARGALCFQVIVTERGEAALFELNARFGGGYPLAHRAGARFAQWLIEEAAGLPSSASDAWKAGVTMLRHDTAVFLE